MQQQKSQNYNLFDPDNDIPATDAVRHV